MSYDIRILVYVRVVRVLRHSFGGAVDNTTRFKSFTLA